jgi:hypothetical protein
MYGFVVFAIVQEGTCWNWLLDLGREWAGSVFIIPRAHLRLGRDMGWIEGDVDSMVVFECELTNEI